MIELSLQIEGQNGLNWTRWKNIVAAVEETGYAALYRSDHFTNPNPPDLDSLEMIVSLTYLADHTKRMQFGPLVAPFSFRDPVFLTRQAAAIDDLSNGRLILGLGAGWQEREHQHYGYDLNTLSTRMQRFEEGLEVTSRLLKSEEPVTYTGTFYKLQDAVLLPRTQRVGGPRILIGGNGLKRTLPLAARYADIWNGVFLSPEDFKSRSAQLDILLEKEGRPANSVKRTLFAGTDITQDPETLLKEIRQFEAIGVEELVLWWNDFDDADGIRRIGERILPQLQS
ncbi:MAG TPA: TIGR03560 family F420-dependent LLM class oxidoreductase [Ktedonobacteraceae bacterium]|jgi:F420-dependent oxidoreductase-like protein|nr:TIGR03560 family F420-dependent LLM class oxidoreductase [Ktedonobacteraceae bacterium]